jgi:hypothetical protein
MQPRIDNSSNCLKLQAPAKLNARLYREIERPRRNNALIYSRNGFFLITTAIRIQYSVLNHVGYRFADASPNVLIF